MAREFKAPSDLLVLNQPTRGVDVGAISFIHSKILEMRSHNKAILLSSADLNELISLSDRILVMHKGKEMCIRDSNDTSMIAVIMSNRLNPFFANVLDAIEEQAAMQGYSILFFNTSEDKERERNAVAQAMEHRV